MVFGPAGGPFTTWFHRGPLVFSTSVLLVGLEVQDFLPPT